jgi:glycosyltransferase involved in cell wall biosynthesis
MKILLATVQVPFIRGGAEIHAENLQLRLRNRGFQVDTVAIPFKWYPATTLLQSMVIGRMLDLTEVNGQRVDLLIGLKFPAYYAPHPRKVIWLLHQHRQAYDLWGTQFGDIHKWDNADYVRNTIAASDNAFLREAKALFTNSRNVSNRLLRYNAIPSEPLYHPPPCQEKLHCSAYEPFVFYPSRIDGMKRQRELVEAARYMKSDMRVVIAGQGSASEMDALKDLIRVHKLESRVQLLGYISDEEKIDLLARCMAVYFGAYDEDYGYVTLEAMFSQKPVITYTDSGGTLEFVEDNRNGYVVEPDPRAVAARLDELASNPALARQLGTRALQTMREKKVSWDHVIDTLLEAGGA